MQTVFLVSDLNCQYDNISTRLTLHDQNALATFKQLRCKFKQ